jgi:hypothetical protein
VVTHHATGMVAMGMRQEHMVQRSSRERAFAHVDAKIEFRNLDVRRKSGNRKTGNRRTGRIDVHLSQCVMYVFAFVHFFTESKFSKLRWIESRANNFD